MSTDSEREAAREQLEALERYKAEGHIDPNSIPDDVADAAAIAEWEFVSGFDDEPLTPRQLGITRQATKVAIAAALDKLNSKQ